MRPPANDARKSHSSPFPPLLPGAFVHSLCTIDIRLAIVQATEHLKVLFPNQIKLTAPASQPQLGRWRRQMEEDGAQSRATSNRHTIHAVVER